MYVTFVSFSFVVTFNEKQVVWYLILKEKRCFTNNVREKTIYKETRPVGNRDSPHSLHPLLTFYPIMQVNGMRGNRMFLQFSAFSILKVEACSAQISAFSIWRFRHGSVFIFLKKDYCLFSESVGDNAVCRRALSTLCLLIIHFD